uniref:Ubiquitin-like protease family profile domain-containing protein n=1 Tax=Glossina austeni TaxID=7395 RepID=A0A1A9VH02_GLOAU
MVKSSWVYSLRKQELSDICVALDLDTKGTVEEMRKAVAALIATPDLSAEIRTRFAELEMKYATKTLHSPPVTERGTSPKWHFQEQISCGAAMDRICKWSVSFNGETCALEFIGRVEELCEVYALLPDLMPRHFARNCVSQRAPACWDCGRPSVLTKNCCRQIAGQHTQAREMTVKEPIKQWKPPSGAVPKIMEVVGSTLIASLTVGGLPATGMVDTGATRNIIRKDVIGFISSILSFDASRHTIRMADGSSQEGKSSITVEVGIGDMTLNLRLLVVTRCVDHLTLGMDFLAKTGAELSVAGCPVKLGSREGTPTTTTAAKKNQATCATETPPTPDLMSISSIMQTEIKAATDEGVIRDVDSDTLTEARHSPPEPHHVPLATWSDDEFTLEVNVVNTYRNKIDCHFATYLKVNLTSGDFQRLLPGRRINDRIIEFYAQWLLKGRVAAKKGTVYTIDSLGRYPNEAIATNVRRYIEFLNMMKHGHDINIDQNTMPMREVSVPLQGNQLDCGIFLLKNLEHYLSQSGTNWDPLTLPEAWCTRAEAGRTRTKIAAVLLELAGKGEGDPVGATEPTGTSDQIDDVILTTPAEPPVTLRTMTAIAEPRTLVTEGVNSDNEEPITLGVIKRRNTDEVHSLIKPTIGVADGATPPTRVEFGDNDEWIPLETDDPHYLYLQEKYRAADNNNKKGIIKNNKSLTIRYQGSFCVMQYIHLGVFVADTSSWVHLRIQQQPQDLKL